MRRRLDERARVQFITHTTPQYSYTEGARMALEGGCRWIQVRMKGAPLDEVEATAREVLAMCRTYGAVCLLDDHVELARKIGADGVHVGQNDMPVQEARALLGDDFIIGGTANTTEQIVAHAQHGADYVGCGPYRFTTTKQNLSPIVGLEGYATRMQQLHEAGIDIPVVAIGGITTDDIPALMATGIGGIALSGSVLRASDPVAMMREVILESGAFRF